MDVRCSAVYDMVHGSTYFAVEERRDEHGLGQDVYKGPHDRWGICPREGPAHKTGCVPHMCPNTEEPL